MDLATSGRVRDVRRRRGDHHRILLHPSFYHRHHLLHALLRGLLRAHAVLHHAGRVRQQRVRVLGGAERPDAIHIGNDESNVYHRYLSSSSLLFNLYILLIDIIMLAKITYSDKNCTTLKSGTAVPPSACNTINSTLSTKTWCDDQVFFKFIFILFFILGLYCFFLEERARGAKEKEGYE
jgi:hypothetical protein